MREVRVFVDAALASDTSLRLPTGAAEHVLKVLRLRVGAPLTLFDGRGGEYAAQIAAIESRTAVVTVGRHDAVEREAPRLLTLWATLLRGEKMDWVIQKATELGAHRVVPVVSERSVVQLDAERADRRLQHWRDVAAAACEQCGRNRLPLIDPPRSLARALADVPAAPDAQRIVLVPDAGSSLRAQVGAAPAVELLVGPEGGLSPTEIELAHRVGFEAAQLGPRILRAETAMLAALAIVQS